MKFSSLPFLCALGLAASAFAGAQPQGRSDATSGYGMTSGGTAGMQSEAGTDVQSDANLADMPQPRTSGDVTWMCGGVGESEIAYMQQQARNFDLKLTFASASGAYLANIDVDIRGPQGESVLQTNCDGPIMLVDLPGSGVYQIAADADGFQQASTVRLSSDRKRTAQNVFITWPRSAVAEMGTGAPTSGGDRSSGRSTN